MGINPVLMNYVLIFKINPLAVCLQETDNITIIGFNIYHTFQEAENRVLLLLLNILNKNLYFW